MEWVKTEDRPADIPASPSGYYSDSGWTNWSDWLGTDTIAHQNRVFRPFEQARAFARSLNLEKKDEWVEWVKTEDRPADIPADPRTNYSESGWINWPDWLGSDPKFAKNRNYKSFTEARKFVRLLGLRSQSEWYEWAKSSDRPSDIPSTPHQLYKDLGWKGLDDWLGK